MGKPPTIYDVADRAGVSISTVSLALNRPGRVSETSLAKVFRAVDDLGFHPKSDFVSRARRGVGRIGVLAPFTSYPSFHQRLNGILGGLSAAGQALEVVVFDHESIATTSSPLLDSLPLSGRLDGLIVMGVPLTDTAADRLVTKGLPTILVDVERPHRQLPTVRIDDHYGGVLVAEHLLARRAAVYAYLGEAQASESYVSQAQRRLVGFRDGLAAAGQMLPDPHVEMVPHTLDDAARGATRLLARLPLPVAVFAYSDLLAAGVLTAARGLNLRVPEDVAVAGFDDSDLAAALELTSVHQPLQESGHLAVQLLVQQLRTAGGSPSSVADVTVKLHVVARSSTGGAVAPGRPR